MNILILLIFLLLLTICKITGEYCGEQKCVEGSYSWCCPFSSICGSFGICNDTMKTNRDTYCPDEKACFSGQYYWCCSADETCGDFRRCEGGSADRAPYALIGVGIGFSVLLLIVGICCHIRRQNQQKMNYQNRINLATRDQRRQIEPIAFINMGQPNKLNPVEQSFTVPISDNPVVQVEQPANSVSSPSTIQ